MPLRPSFLGARYSGGLFLQFAVLSGVTNTEPMTIYAHSSSENDVDDIPPCLLEEPHHGDNAKEIMIESRPQYNASNDLESKYPVIDRDINNKETLVEYKFSTLTKDLFHELENLEIKFDIEIYKPKDLRLSVSKNTFYCKNLFLKDRKGQFYLVICHEDLNIDLKLLRKQLNAYRNFNFGTADDMATLLNVEPGGVTPLALMFSSAVDVQMVIHNSVLQEDALCMFHPMDSNVAVKISMDSLLRFLKHFKHGVKIIK